MSSEATEGVRNTRSGLDDGVAVCQLGDGGRAGRKRWIDPIGADHGVDGPNVAEKTIEVAAVMMRSRPLLRIVARE